MLSSVSVWRDSWRSGLCCAFLAEHLIYHTTKLYVRCVFIMGDFDELMFVWINIMKAVVDYGG